MKNRILTVLFCLVLLSGCSAHRESANPTEQTDIPLQIGNPWKSYDSMEEAATACGFAFPLPELVAGSYESESYRVMNGQLMEVVYVSGEQNVIVRMQSGEGQDISGVYGNVTKTESLEVNDVPVTHNLVGSGCLYLTSKDGFSYSLYVHDGCQENILQEFLLHICQ